MKKLLASVLAVSMAAGMAVSVSAANIKDLKVVGNLTSSKDKEIAFGIDYSVTSNRDTYKFPDVGDEGQHGDFHPVYVYGDTKEYNVLLYNMPKSAKVHVQDGKVRVSTRKYSAQDADHDGNVLPGSRLMGEGYYSAVDQFSVPYSYVSKATVPSGITGTVAFDIKTVWRNLNSSDTNGTTDTAGDLSGTAVVDAVPVVDLPTTADGNLPAPSVKSNDTTRTKLGTLTNEAVYTTDKGDFNVTAVNGSNADDFDLTIAKDGSAPAAAYITAKPNAQQARAYFDSKKVDGKNYLVAGKRYMFYNQVGGAIEQTIVEKGQWVDTNGLPVDEANKVETAQYAYGDDLNDTTLGGGTTIEPGSIAQVLTIKSNHGPRDTKEQDFKIEVDVQDGNTFYIEGVSAYSNIREVTDDDRLTVKESDDAGSVFRFGEKLYETARIRVTDFVDLYFNGNYDTNRENLRVSTDEISEIKDYFKDYDVDYVNFIARPKFATPVTVIIDADANSFIYEYDEKTGDVTLMNDDKATYDSTDGWKFKDNTLGIYLIFEEEYENANIKADKEAPTEEPEDPAEVPSTSTDKPNPGTGANDMLGAAAAMAVVSLIAAGAVAVRKLSK